MHLNEFSWILAMGSKKVKKIKKTEKIKKITKKIES
jgi:hypothetical protein